MILRLGVLKLVIHLPVVVLQLGDDLALGLPGQVRAAAPALDGEESHSLRLRIALQTLNLRRQGLHARPQRLRLGDVRGHHIEGTRTRFEERARAGQDPAARAQIWMDSSAEFEKRRTWGAQVQKRQFGHVGVGDACGGWKYD